MRAPASLLHLHAAAEQLQASSSSSAAAAAPAGSSAPPSPPADQPPPVNSDMVVILASFLCALICVLGLALVSRCACRRFVASSAVSSSDPTQQQQTSSPPGPPPPRGLKKKAIDALPTVSFTKPSAKSPAAGASSSECAICLADFAEGEALRVLPRCGHGFHVACVDAWLRTRATCPSCRSAIVVAQAQAQEAPVVAAACGRCGQVLPRPPGPGQPSNADTFLPWTTSPPLHAS